MQIDLWIDFNEVDAGGRAVSLAQLASPPGRIFEPGETIVVGDDEGNCAKAHVISAEVSGVVEVSLIGGVFLNSPDGLDTGVISAARRIAS